MVGVFVSSFVCLVCLCRCSCIVSLLCIVSVCGVSVLGRLSVFPVCEWFCGCMSCRWVFLIGACVCVVSL